MKEVIVTIGKFQGLTIQHVAMIRFVEDLARGRGADIVIIVSDRENVIDDDFDSSKISQIKSIPTRKRTLAQRSELKKLTKIKDKRNRRGKEFGKVEGKNDAPLPVDVRIRHIEGQLVQNDRVSIVGGNPVRELYKIANSGKYDKLTVVIGGDRTGAFTIPMTSLIRKQEQPIEFEEVIFGDPGRTSDNAVSSSKLRAAILAENYHLGKTGRSLVTPGNKILIDYPTLEEAQKAINEMTPLRGEELNELKHYIVENTGMKRRKRKTKKRRKSKKHRKSKKRRKHRKSRH